MSVEYRTSYQIKWQGALPAHAPAGVSIRNWEVFAKHVRYRRSMYSLATEYSLTRARVSAIISRVHQLASQNDQPQPGTAAHKELIASLAQ